MTILGVKISNFTKKETLQKVESFLFDGGQHHIVTPNPEMIVLAQRDEEFKKILNEADLAVADGAGLIFASRILGDVKTSDVQNVRHPMFQGHRMSVQNQRTSDVDTNAIIITERSDKIFFPSRRVIIWKRGEALDDSFKKLSEFAPLYYYNIAFTDEEFRIMNQELSKSDLQLELVKVFGNEALYKIIFNF